MKLIHPFVPSQQSAVLQRSFDPEYQEKWCLLNAENQVDVLDLSMLTITHRFGDLIIQAKGMLRLDIAMQVWEDDETLWEKIIVPEKGRYDAVDEGKLAQTWFTTLLGRHYRLMKLVKRCAD
ncbi:hypothetical protein [Basilea psittacipulmonis]|uniref:hypothetical protein n=1 Tax=Basilea psittacipulmonis TaxID=1472345 RepID=UPI000690AEEE|nr:hypothetical protein [Basilea psittacipulmonis]